VAQSEKAAAKDLKPKESAGTKSEEPKASHVEIPAGPAPAQTEGQKATKAESKPSKGVDGMISSSKEYWDDAAKRDKEKGGVSGYASFLADSLMKEGVKAFEAGHNVINEVFPDGIIQPARERWKEIAKQGNEEGGISGHAKEVAARTMDGLLAISGLEHVETGVSKVVKDLDEVVPEEKLKSDLKWLGIDTALAAATFVPGFGAAAKGEAVYRTAKAGSEIAGMVGTGARVSESVGAKLAEAAKEALPATGENLSKESLTNFVGKLQEIAGKYGIELKKGGVVGESTGSINTIEYSSKAGGPHEIVHVVQQLQTRATALEARAVELGKKVGDLTQAERLDVFNKVVKPFEETAYNQHEMFAGAAHSWGHTSSQYREVIMENLKSFQKALASATVPEAKVNAAAKAYGELPNLLGRSQKEIAKNLGSPTANTFGHIFDNYWKEND
ncbi:MAG: hypothetical protein K2X81_23610, partial [Candidatus Obscuribacterales bacterium]|nr:hypothetical protein [Candidatus Obscuribacterales bacterium]